MCLLSLGVSQMLTGGNKVYSEVEGMQLLLQYQVCRVKYDTRSALLLCAHLLKTCALLLLLLL